MRVRTLLLVSALVTFATSTASAKMTFTGGFETGDLSQWGEKINAHRISVVTTPVLEGTKAGRFEIHQGDVALANKLVRVELGWHPTGKMEGTEGYYAWSAMPSNDQPFVAGSHQITYWECDKIYKQVMSFHVDGSEVSLATRIPTSKTIWKGAFAKGKWHAFVLHVKWSPDPKVGFVELWYEGAKVVDKTMVATQHVDGGVALDNFIHQGIFRGGDTIKEVEVMFLDATVAGTTLEDVMPPAAVDAGVSDAAPTMDASEDVAEAAVEDTSIGDTATAAPDTTTPSGGEGNDLIEEGGAPAASGCGCRTSRAGHEGAWLTAIALGVVITRRQRR